MRKQKKGIIRKICTFVGVILLVSALIVLVLWQRTIQISEQQAKKYVEAIRELTPESQGAVPDARKDNTMSVLSLEGEDFVGLLEMPGHGSAMPVCASWGGVTKYPCHFDGNIYEQTMQIGATSQKGQYDFYREISVGESVFFTDMEGNRYAYTITNIRYEKKVDQTLLEREDAPLTLFIKNIYAFEYIIIYCDVLT